VVLSPWSGTRRLLAYDIVVADGLDTWDISQSLGYDVDEWNSNKKTRTPDWYKKLPFRNHLYLPELEMIYESPNYAYKHEASSPVGADGQTLYETMYEKGHAYSTQAIEHARRVDKNHPQGRIVLFGAADKREAKGEGVKDPVLDPQSRTSFDLMPSVLEIHQPSWKKLYVPFAVAALTSALLVGGPLSPVFWLVPSALGFALAGANYWYWKRCQSRRDSMRSWCRENGWDDSETRTLLKEGERAVAELRMLPGITEGDILDVHNLTRKRVNHRIAQAYLEAQRATLNEEVYALYLKRLGAEQDSLRAQVAGARESITQLRLKEMMDNVLEVNDPNENLDAMLAAANEVEQFPDLLREIEKGSTADNGQEQAGA
jgi:hypothetical protein